MALTRQSAEEGTPTNYPVARAEALLERARKRAAMAQGFKAQGREVLERAQVKRCTDILFAAVECDPSCMNARFMLVGCLLQLKDFELAKKEAIDAIFNLSEDRGAALEDPAMHLAAAYASLGVGDTDHAISLLRYAMRTFPQDPQPCAALSSVLERRGSAREARDIAALALARENDEEGRRLLPAQRERVDGLLAEAKRRDDGDLGADCGDAVVGSSLPHWSLGAEVDVECAGPSVSSANDTPPAPQPPAPSSSRVRSRPFGPAVPESSPRSETAVREAAMKDLEALFSTLMPAQAFRRDGPDGAPVAEAAQISAAPCCLCRKRTPGS